MTLGMIINSYRVENGMSMDDFAKASGISKAYISLLEKNVNPQTGKVITPSIRSIKLAASAMGRDFDSLFKQLEGSVSIGEDAIESEGYTIAEEAMVEEYRSLDDHGKKVVDYVLDEEYARSIAMQEEDPNLKIYPYLGAVAAAGSAVYPGDIPIEQIKVRKLNGADFIVGVSGNSMEPTYYDGQKVYVKKTTDLEFGDIGLFIVNGYYYIKELAPDGLRSHNPKWALIPKGRDIIVVGKVLGPVDEK